MVFVYAATAILCGLASILIPFLWWAEEPNNPEPRYAFLAMIVFFLLSMTGLTREIAFSVDAVAGRQRRRDKFRIDAAWISDALEHELRNFAQIQSRKQLKPGSHRDAVEITSFKIVEDEVRKLQSRWGYQGLVTSILDEITRNEGLPPGGKDAGKLTTLVNQLLVKLKPHVPSEEELLVMRSPDG